MWARNIPVADPAHAGSGRSPLGCGRGQVTMDRRVRPALTVLFFGTWQSGAGLPVPGGITGLPMHQTALGQAI